MAYSSRSHHGWRWPFWALLAAWFCANTPPVLTLDVLVWVGNARHFAHQRQLQADVADLLSTAPRHEVVARSSAAMPLPVSNLLTDNTIKKTELALVTAPLFPAPRWQPYTYFEKARETPGRICGALPLRPPRSRLYT